MRSLIVLITILTALFTSNLQASEIIEPLSIDGCTGIEEGNWGHCCYEHDVLYWIGGSADDRFNADKRLSQCVAKAGGPEGAFFNAVRVFGKFLWAKAFGARDMESLTQEELEQIDNEQKLFESIGSPITYEFVIRESIIFQPLTSKQRSAIRKDLSEYAQLSEYKSFVEAYKRETGELPITLKFHD